MSRQPNNISRFWQELKRRKVFSTLAMYAATAFIAMEAADIVLPRLGFPDWTVTILIVILMAGFPIVAVISWIYDITPEGILKTKEKPIDKEEPAEPQAGKRILTANNVVIAILFVAVNILLYPKIFPKPVQIERSSESSQTISLIGVLPFSNTKPNPDTDYLGFAMADQIIGELLYLQNLTVRSSGSVRKYTHRAMDPFAVGDSLNVDYVLSGSYLLEANILRLNIELVDVNSRELLWREPIEVDFKSTFELQDMVALRVVEGLNIQFRPQDQKQSRKDIPRDPLAYEYYLRSISYPFTIEGDRMAIEMLRKSIELDSTYAPSYAQLAARVHTLAQYELHGPEEFKKAETLFLKALSLNKDHIFALANLATMYTENSRTEEAVELTKQIMTLNSNNAEAHYSLGYIYRYAGMNREAVEEMEKATAMDPEFQGFRSIIISYQYAGEYEKAFEASKQYKESEFILGYQGAFLFRLGKNDQAMDYFNRCLDMDPDGLQALWVTGLKAYLEGNPVAGLEAAQKFEKVNLQDAEAWYHFAGNYALLGDRDGAIRALKRAVDGGFYNYPFMIRDAFLDSIRGDDEFQVILEEARQKHLAFKKKFF